MSHKVEENLTLKDLLNREGSKKPQGKAASLLLTDLYRSSMERDSQAQGSVPMITLKHRWMKNRTVVVGNTVIPFDSESLARVPDLANARLDCEAYVRSSKGLAEILPLEAPEAPSEPQAAPEAPKKKAVLPEPKTEKAAPAAAEEPEEAEEPKGVEMPLEEVLEEPKEAPVEEKKSPPARKKPVRKKAAKKSS